MNEIKNKNLEKLEIRNKYNLEIFKNLEYYNN